MIVGTVSGKRLWDAVARKLVVRCPPPNRSRVRVGNASAGRFCVFRVEESMLTAPRVIGRRLLVRRNCSILLKDPSALLCKSSQYHRDCRSLEEATFTSSGEREGLGFSHACNAPPSFSSRPEGKRRGDPPLAHIRESLPALHSGSHPISFRHCQTHFAAVTKHSLPATQVHLADAVQIARRVRVFPGSPVDVHWIVDNRKTRR